MAFYLPLRHFQIVSEVMFTLHITWAFFQHAKGETQDSESQGMSSHGRLQGQGACSRALQVLRYVRHHFCGSEDQPRKEEKMNTAAQREQKKNFAPYAIRQKGAIKAGNKKKDVCEVARLKWFFRLNFWAKPGADGGGPSREFWCCVARDIEQSMCEGVKGHMVFRHDAVALQVSELSCLSNIILKKFHRTTHFFMLGN